MVAESNEDLMEDVLREGHARRRRTWCAGCAQAVLAGSVFPVLPTVLRRATSGLHPLLDAHRGPAALARRPRRGHGHRPRQPRQRQRASPPPTRRFSAFVFKTHRRSARGPHLAVPRLLRHAQGRQHGAQHHPRRGRARGRAGAAAGQDADAGAGDPGRRHRRGGQAQGDADRRHAVPTRRTRSSTRR